MSQDTSSRRYKLIRTLGKGSFSKVKEAVHIVSGELVAIKVLDKAMITKEEDLMRIRREIKILKTSNHPNLISLYEIMETEKYYFFVMEHAAGGELSKYICDRGKLDEKKSCRFFRQLIIAVEYMHKLGYAHRDIKPSNILLKDDLELKLIDFGLGNIYSTGEMLETPCGSPCYAAPELVTGKPYNGICVDIWSSGITLFAMLCGFLPFNDDSRKELFRKISACEYNMPEWLSPSAKDLIRKIFVSNPKKRITIDEIKNHAWFNIFKEESIALQKLEEYATESEIQALTCHYMGQSEDKLKKMVQDNQANKFTCCFKLFMLKRQNKRLTKEDIQFIHQRRIGDCSTDLTLNRNMSRQESSKESSSFRRDDSLKRSGGVRLPSIKGKEQTGLMTEILAKGLLKRAFADKLKHMSHSTDRRNNKESFDISKDISVKTHTEEHRERSQRSGGVKVEHLANPGDAFIGSMSRDGSPPPVSQTQGAVVMTEGYERRDSQKSRQVLRINTQNLNSLTLKNPRLANYKSTKDNSREGKVKLSINTTWDGKDFGRESKRENSNKSISRNSNALNHSIGPSTPNNRSVDKKQTINIKNMIKNIISTGEKISVTKRVDRSQDKSEKTATKPAFFNQLVNHGHIKLKSSIPNDASFTSNNANHSIVRSMISPKSPVIPIKQHFSN